MKKPEVQRFDLERVYWLGVYTDTISYANQNMHIEGVKEHLASLQTAKERYCGEVRALVQAERGNEQQKFETYKRWAGLVPKLTVAFFGLLAMMILVAVIGDRVPHPFHGVLLNLIEIFLMLIFAVCGLAVVVAIFCRKRYAGKYQQYTAGLSARLGALGREFKTLSQRHYSAIDDLYLGSLDATHRELVLLRREQAEQNKKAERDRQRLQEQLLHEQQKARAAQEELLAIERKREAEREAARRRW